MVPVAPHVVSAPAVADIAAPSPGLAAALAPTAAPFFSLVLDNNVCLAFDVKWSSTRAGGVEHYVSDAVHVPELGLAVKLIRNDMRQMAVLVTQQTDIQRWARIPNQFMVSGLAKADGRTSEAGILNWLSTPQDQADFMAGMAAPTIRSFESPPLRTMSQAGFSPDEYLFHVHFRLSHL